MTEVVRNNKNVDLNLMKNIGNFWLERCTKWCGDNLQILQTTQTTEIYQYCDNVNAHA